MKTIGTISEINIEKLKEYLENNIDKTELNMKELYEFFNDDEDRKIVKRTEYMYSNVHMKSDLEKLRIQLDFMTEYTQNMDLCFINDAYVIVRGLDGQTYWLIPREYVKYTLYKDYSNIPLGQLRLEGNIKVENSLADTETYITKSSKVEMKQEEIEQELNKIKQLEDEKKIELERIRQEIEAKYRNKMEIIEAKKAEMEKALSKLRGELFLLDTEIYGIRCFFGETVNFVKISSGNRLKDEEPVILYQKLRYLDEELAKINVIHGFDGSDCNYFEDLVKTNANIRNIFFPEGKTVSLVRISADLVTYKSSQKYSTHGGRQITVQNIIEKYEVFHGTKIAVLVRNGDNCYIGWTDIDKIELFDDKAFYNPKIQQIEEDTGKEVKSTSKEEIASRYFIFSILEGLIANSKILNLPSGEGILNNSEYVIYSLADGWLEDNRYGNLADIFEKYKKEYKKGDAILTLRSLSAEGNKYRTYSNDRGRGYRNRTHDVYASDCTIYKLNQVDKEQRIERTYKKLVTNIEDEEKKWERYITYDPIVESEDLIILDVKTTNRYEYYVALEKEIRWDRNKASTANFQLYDDEFINLTFLNSELIKYLISNKHACNCYYNGYKYSLYRILPYLNKMLEYLLEREGNEYDVICKYTDLSEVDNWLMLLSEWKISTDVRIITEYQARRFANYIISRRNK